MRAGRLWRAATKPPGLLVSYTLALCAGWVSSERENAIVRIFGEFKRERPPPRLRADVRPNWEDEAAAARTDR